MRLNRIILFIVLLVSLVACNPVSTTPVPINTPQVETPLATTPASISTTVISTIELVSTPELTHTPSSAIEASAEIQELPMSVTQSVTITIIYDNNPSDQRLTTAWGFSALVEAQDHTLLFDTGGDGQLLMDNMRTLGIDPTRIDSVALSHAHDDHTGGLKVLLSTGVKPPVYLLPSFPTLFKHQIEQFTQVNQVSAGQSFAGGLFTTGEMGGMIREQALVIRTAQGLVVITGCAHPGIVSIIEQSQEMFAEPVRLVLGGFHLGDKTEAEINAILEDFQRLGVQQVAPCHCTGELAIHMFAEEYGDDFIPVGVGSVITLDE